MFQFHEGPIKTIEREKFDISFQGFNSMKVRLKPFLAMLNRLIAMFQFHEGPIKTHNHHEHGAKYFVSIP